MISNDPKVILLTADLGFGAFECFEPFRDKQYFNVGISEQLMASMAAGLSLEGFKVFIYSIYLLRNSKISSARFALNLLAANSVK